MHVFYACVIITCLFVGIHIPPPPNTRVCCISEVTSKKVSGTNKRVNAVLQFSTKFSRFFSPSQFQSAVFASNLGFRHTRYIFLSLNPLSLSHTYTLSLKHTHTHICLTLSLCLSLCLDHTLPISFSLFAIGFRKPSPLPFCYPFLFSFLANLYKVKTGIGKGEKNGHIFFLQNFGALNLQQDKKFAMKGNETVSLFLPSRRRRSQFLQNKKIAKTKKKLECAFEFFQCRTDRRWSKACFFRSESKKTGFNRFFVVVLT